MKKTMFPFFHFAAATVALGWISFGVTSISLGQDKEKAKDKEEKKDRIRIVDRDGRELSPKVVVGDQVIHGAPGNALKVQITNDNGVITIRDAEGKEHKINAASVIISQSQKTTVENGEEKTESVKKAIVVDSEGKTYEIDLATGDQVEGASVPRIFAQSNVGKFMIGIVAQPASEALAEQLNLEPQTGLVVAQVSPDSPAEKAGLKENDVLLFADQQALKTVDDLLKAIQKAGEAKEELALTLVRDEEEISIRVTPQERNMALFGGEGRGMLRLMNPDFKMDMEQMDDFDFGWAQAGPGFVFNPQDFDAEALKAQIEKMQEQHRMNLDRMKEAFQARNEAMRRREEAAAKNSASNDQVKELLDEVKRLREEIELLKKEKK